MDNTERIALLRRVAEVAPKEMRATLLGHSWSSIYVDGIFNHSVTFQLISKWEADGGEPTDSSLACLGLASDIEDAPACFAMLEAMEKAGYAIGLASFTPGAKGYRVEWWRDLRDARDNPERCEFGDTRAEAVARAFVRVFGGD